jgi:glycopeptide antibiotics resistance protein
VWLSASTVNGLFYYGLAKRSGKQYRRSFEPADRKFAERSFAGIRCRMPHPLLRLALPAPFTVPSSHAQPQPTKMQKRSLTAFVLVGYSAFLIVVVVFKGPMKVAEWARPGREERVEGGRPGRGRGDPANVGRAESRTGGRRGRTPSALPATRLSTSRFAPVHANYIPFKTILPQLRGRPRWSNAVINLAVNTVLFVPVGILVPLVYRRVRWQESLVLAVAVGVTMEVMEGVFRVGQVDVDDVILNALGVMTGYWIYRVWARRRETEMVRPN